ncbi:hypothetical protein Tco_1032909 [Tanacetum coccineum]|uniref:Uncharacterized protein n=1 Tax=Tanacetum coccineum TaxID=301880 RepID=A0ABQ5GE69_9ASTR
MRSLILYRLNILRRCESGRGRVRTDLFGEYEVSCEITFHTGSYGECRIESVDYELGIWVDRVEEGLIVKGDAGAMSMYDSSDTRSVLCLYSVHLCRVEGCCLTLYASTMRMETLQSNDTVLILCHDNEAIIIVACDSSEGLITSARLRYGCTIAGKWAGRLDSVGLCPEEYINILHYIGSLHTRKASLETVISQFAGEMCVKSISWIVSLEALDTREMCAKIARIVESDWDGMGARAR